jgi:RimJ/RimL family protein N-acetyltransferase
MSDARLDGLRLRTPRLELRLGSEAELRALAELARAGIHEPGEMPFEVAWTDTIDSPTFVDEFLGFHRARAGASTPAAWRLELITFLGGSPIGTQGVGADNFAAEREVFTGSWLGRAWQRQGLGTEQRAAVLQLAFEGLDARAALSGAWEQNHGSLGVSRKLGYEDVGLRLAYPRGEPVPHRLLRLERDTFRPPVPVEIEGLDGLRSFLGIDKLD